MKRRNVFVAILMMFGLIIAIFFYEKSNQIELPQYIAQELGDQEIQRKRSEQLQPIYEDEDIAYSLRNEELNITLDQGKNWLTVPIEKDKLFNERYTGDKQELIEQSYILTKNRMAFIYWEESRISLIYSLDQGETWLHTFITGIYAPLGFHKAAFIDDQFGYALITGERVASQEVSVFFVTHDGGENWEGIFHPDTMSLVLEGGFVDEKTGFLSVGPINPDKPVLHVTQDGGNTWNEAKVNVPTEYEEIFIIAEMPSKEGEDLAVFVNQGPQGDYRGGKVKGKFISKDNGATWEFSMEVKQEEEEEG